MCGLVDAPADFDEHFDKVGVNLSDKFRSLGLVRLMTGSAAFQSKLSGALMLENQMADDILVGPSKAMDRSLVKTSYLQQESDFKRFKFNSMPKSVIEVFEIEYCRGHRTTADISCVLSWQVQTKCLQVAYEVPYGFPDLVRWS